MSKPFTIPAGAELSGCGLAQLSALRGLRLTKLDISMNGCGVAVG